VGHEPAPSKREDRPIGQHHQTQVAGPDDKKAPPELGTDGAKTPMEPGAVAVSQPAAAVPHSSGQTPIPGIVEMRTDPSVVQTVSEQILDSVRASVTPGEGQISVRLQPPELGMVTVRLRERGEWLEGTLEVEKSDTRREIERTLPEVVRGLQDAGIQVHKLDVTGSDSPKPDLGSGAGPQDGGSAQNGPGQNRDHLPASHTPGLQENVNYLVRLEETAATGRLISASPGRIDMLL
jgi:flagellar hook-length control protein FliK